MKRRVVWALILVVLTLLSPLTSWLLHSMVLWFKSGSWSWRPDYIQAMHELLADNQVRQWWVISQLAILAATIYMMIEIRPRISQVDVVQVTDDIQIPVPAGNGQHGNERFLSENEKAGLFQVFLYSGKEKLKTKGGLVVQMVKKGEKELVYYIREDIHSLIIGATRSGKTRRVLLETMWLQMMGGQSVIVSDVKGELYYYTSEYARSLGYQVTAIDLRNPSKSVHYNFLQPVLDAFAAGDRARGIDYAWDLVSALVGQQKGEPIWYNGETATIAAVILIVALEAPPQCRNLANVYYFLAYMSESDANGNKPLNRYLEGLDDSHPAKGVFAVAKIAAEKTRDSFYTAALGTLRLFTNPKVAEMTSCSDINLKDISRRKTAFYMMIPDEKKTLYPIVSILVTQMYTLQVELASESGLRLPVDTDYDLDELGNFPTIPVLGNMLSAGASRGVRVNMVLQDYQQLETNYKDDHKNIRTNCQAKLYLKSDDPDTLKNVSETVGKYTVEVSSASTSMQDSRKTESINYSSSAALTGRALLEPAEVKRIKSPYAVCMMTGEYAGINILPDLSEYRINSQWGLGDQEHNRKIILEREAERGEREVSGPCLWGIWKQYRDAAAEVTGDEQRISFL